MIILVSLHYFEGRTEVALRKAGAVRNSPFSRAAPVHPLPGAASCVASEDTPSRITTTRSIPKPSRLATRLAVTSGTVGSPSSIGTARRYVSTGTSTTTTIVAKRVTGRGNTSAPSVERASTPPSLGPARKSPKMAIESFLAIARPIKLLYTDFWQGVVHREPSGSVSEPFRSLFHKIVTPYDADVFEQLLKQHDLTSHYPLLPYNLRVGFPIGDMPRLEESVVFPNHPSCKDYMKDVNAYLDLEVAAGRMAGPFSLSVTELILGGPVYVSPLIVAVSPQEPGNRTKSASAAISPKETNTRTLLILISSRSLSQLVLILPLALRTLTCPVAPAHKCWLVVQGDDGKYYIEHVFPFGTASASSNAGMIANAAVDIWVAKGVEPILKYEDDLDAFRFPSIEGPFEENGKRYKYDKTTMLKLIEELRIPWHPEKGDGVFRSVFTYIGFRWDIDKKEVSLPDEKRLKFLERTRRFLADFENKQLCTLNDVERIHGSLCHVAFIYIEGRSRLSFISRFACSYAGNRFIMKFLTTPVITELKWWMKTLGEPSIVRSIQFRGPPVDLNLFVDASTEWGIGILMDSRWAAFRLHDDWKIPGRDICWLETIAIEIIVYFLRALKHRDAHILIHSDNQGTIGAVRKGRSPNSHINSSVRRLYDTLVPLNLSVTLEYVDSRFPSPFDIAAHPSQFALTLNKKAPEQTPTASTHPRTVFKPGDDIFGIIRPRIDILASWRANQRTAEPTPLITSRLFDLLPLNSVTADPEDARALSTISGYPSLYQTSGKRGRKPKVGNEVAPSAFRPHVEAVDRLSWVTPYSIHHRQKLRDKLPDELVKAACAAVIGALAKSTRSTYAAGLLRFTQFCDQWGISEFERMPASYALLCAFIGVWKGRRSGNTIKSWLAGIRAWHILNHAPWCGNDEWVKMARTTANQEGTIFKRPLRAPVSVEHLITLKKALDLSDPFHAAVWACATVSFYGCRRLGETTIPSDGKFSSQLHGTRDGHLIKKRTLSGGARSFSIRIPWTKMTREKGTTIIITATNNELCPYTAFENHLLVNGSPPPNTPLFAFRRRRTWSSMTKATFLDFVLDIFEKAGLEHVQGHSFRIGGAVELLLAGVPPHVVAATGGWSSLAFLLYWRRVEEVIPMCTSKAYNAQHITDLEKIFEAFRESNNIPKTFLTSSDGSLTIPAPPHLRSSRM
ncbi:hypothetical protein NMY22_g5509 [Coprinellus aureogranulatus]|nr:hypothetical protein NMY22_g5509 [Coprinellus aureogranulatus]